MNITIDDLLYEDYEKSCGANPKRHEVTRALLYKEDRTPDEQNLWNSIGCIRMIDSLISYYGYQFEDPYERHPKTAERLITDDRSHRYLAEYIKMLGVDTVKHYAEIRIQQYREWYYTKYYA